MKKATSTRAPAAFALLGAAALLVGTGPRSHAQETARKPGKYASVNGLRMRWS